MFTSHLEPKYILAQLYKAKHDIRRLHCVEKCVTFTMIITQNISRISTLF